MYGLGSDEECELSCFFALRSGVVCQLMMSPGFTENNDLNVVVLCEYMRMCIHTCMYI